MMEQMSVKQKEESPPIRRSRAGQLTEAGSLALATLGFIAFVTVSALAGGPNANHFGFKNSTGGISDEFATQVTPAGFTFIIWGVIFLWQFAWLLYAWTFTCRPEAPRTIPIGTYIAFTISSALNITWLYIFGNALVNLSLIILLAFDLVIYVTISMLTIYFLAKQIVANKMDVTLTRVLVLNGLSFYATWTTIAALLNISIVLQYTLKVNPTTVGTIVLSVLGAVVVVYYFLETTVLKLYAQDVFAVYPVVIWALFVVVFKHWGKAGEGRNVSLALILLLTTAILVLLRSALLSIFYLFRKKPQRGQVKYNQFK